MTYPWTKVYRTTYFTKKQNLCTTKIPYEVKFDHDFTNEEQAKILEHLNTSTLEDLSRYKITNIRAKKLLTHRRKLGEFQNLNQVLAVEGFGAKILQIFCKSLLHPPILENEPTKHVKKTRNYNFVIPDLTHDKVQCMENVVGVCLAPLSVSWCGMTAKDRTLFAWNTHALKLSKEVRHHNEMQLLDAAYDAHLQLPEADTFVLESCSNVHGTQQAANVSVNLQNLQLTSMLMVLLNAQSDGIEPRVMIQRSSLWCRLYGTLIGSERVSAQSLVDDMLAGQPGPYVPPKVPEGIVELYSNKSSLEREAMCSALLLTTCFLDVSVHPMPECLKLLRGRAKVINKQRQESTNINESNDQPASIDTQK